VELKPAQRYFRILARRGEAWSNPSELITLKSKEFPGLPRPVVFQIRWSKESPSGADVYLGEERAFVP
jgi:hypothetical protein